MLRFIYPGGFQGGVLYDHLPGVPDSQAVGTDSAKMAAETVPGGGDRGIRRIFPPAAERDVRGRRKAAAVFELDFQLKDGEGL